MIELTPLTYVVPAACPSQESFEAAVLARTPLARFGESSQARRRFAIDASAADGRFTASLQVASRDGSVADRHVEGDTCTEVIDALALVTALAIDPNARTAPLAAAAQPAVSALPAPPASSAVAAEPRAKPPSRERAASAGARWEPSVGVAATATGGITPTVLFGVAAHAAIERDVAAWWAPSVRLTLQAGRTFEGAGASADFALGVAGLDVCPSAIQGSAFSFRPCVGATAGILHARGITVSTPSSADPFWLDLRGSGRLRWSPAGGRVFVELEAGARVPVTRPTFVFRTPRIVVHEVASIAPEAGIGMGLRFP